MNNGFNPSLLSDLILTAIGNRTHVSFAKDVGITKAHLSRIIHKKYPYPPRKSTLIQIAEKSEGRITEQMLFTACGYEAETDTGEKEAPPLPASSIRKFMETTILSTLNARDLSWSIIKRSESLYDLVIEMDDDSKMTWKFVFLIPDSSGSIEAAFNNAITAIVFTDDSGEKISLVTDQPDAFNRYTVKPASLLNADISFVLIDLNNLLVTRENWIARSRPLKTYMEKYNILKV